MNATPSSDLFSLLRACEIFEDVSPEQFEVISGELTLQALSAGQTFYQQDAPSDSLAILITGRLVDRLTYPDGSETVINEYAPGATVGTSSLLIGHIRSTTVVAGQDSQLLLLSKPGFELLMSLRPDIRTRLEQNLRPQLLNTYLARAIRNLLPDMDLATLQTLQERLEWLDVISGETLFKENDPSDGLYFVIYGRLGYVQGDVLDRPQGEITAGECVGEMGLITGEPRSATVYALRDTLVARLDRPTFDELVQHHPQLVVQLARRVIERNRPHGSGRTQDDRRSNRPATQVFVVVPLASDVPVERFTRRLAAALARTGTTGQITPETVAQAFGRPVEAQYQMTENDILCVRAWLSEQEQFYNYVLYVTDSTGPDDQLTPWTRRCLRQGDLVLLLGAGASGDPSLTPLEQAMQDLAPHARCELVLIQPDDIIRPSGTARWLEPRQVHAPRVLAHHHLRLGCEDDFEHLARYLTGQGVGLVLAGGAARGWAHVGVLKALQEHHIPVDFIGGTSMGSLIAGGYALGMTVRDLIDVARRFASPVKLFDPTLPAVSFFASDKVTRVLQVNCGDTCMEDLWRPCFFCSSNLTRAEVMVHQHGPVWQGMRASLAIPGVFAPVAYNGDLLVDGVVLNNLPVDVMRNQMRGGMVVAVNVIPEVDLDQKYDFGPSLSGLGQILRRLNPLDDASQRAPWIFESLLRVVALNDVHAARAKRWMVDIYITPPVERFNMLDFGSFEPIIEVGYQAANQAIEEWQAQHTPTLPGALPDARPHGPVETLQQALNNLEAYLKQT